MNLLQFKKRSSSLFAFGYAYSLQGLNYLIAFLSLPVVIKSLTIQDYGLLAYLISVATTVTAFCNWGSYTSNIKRTAKTIFENSNLTNKIITTCFVQIIIFLICILLFFLFIIVFPNLSRSFLEPKIVFSALCITLSNLLNPIWIFLCLNKLREFTIFTVLPKLLALVFFHIFLTRFPTILNYSILLFISNILVLPLIIKRTIYLISKYEREQNIKNFYKVKSNLNFKTYFNLALNEIRDDFYPGIGSSINKVLPSSTYLLISSIFGYKVLGLFALAERVQSLVITLSQPIMQAGTPIISYKKNYSNKIKLGLKLLIVISISSIVFSILSYLAAPLLIEVLSSGNAEYIKSVKLFRILIPTIFLNNFLNGFINIILIPVGLNKSILKQSLKSLFINILIIFCFYNLALDPIMIIGISFVAAEIITLIFVFTGTEVRGLFLKRNDY